ncbi:hypothetical protein [Chitinophaga sp. 212800010-3]|uniref:hypothetical protein n=1 Tax=unclassified Chitinophaga TaxID=2619133 RepID=UPI002DECE3EC|nr:Lipoprotein [Chitinophaga sp. 212800010-3]
MDGNEVNITQKHFMLIGMKEAYNDALIKKMQEGLPSIEHPYSKKYDEGNSDTVFHLRKSATTGDYFLHKFDMTAQKGENGETRTQTFYLNHRKEEEGQKVKDNFTYKMAYNFLQGRPVHHAKSDSWERIKPKEKLQNGNYNSERFDKAYGYDVGKVIDEYSVVYKSSLKESLERGNFQKEKFLNKDGKQEELYTTPAIRSGSLILYDLDKKLIPLDQQIEKGFISQELGEKLKQRQLEQQQKEQKKEPQDNKQTNRQSDNQKEKQQQSAKKGQKQKDGEAKPPRKQRKQTTG